MPHSDQSETGVVHSEKMEDVKYFVAIGAGSLTTGLLARSFHASGAPSELLIVFVLLGAAMAYTGVLAASAGEPSASLVGVGFGLGVMFGPIFYGIIHMLVETIKLGFEMGVL